MKANENELNFNGIESVFTQFHSLYTDEIINDFAHYSSQVTLNCLRRKKFVSHFGQKRVKIEK